MINISNKKHELYESTELGGITLEDFGLPLGLNSKHWLFQNQSISININQYQSISININQYQSISININQYQSISININQY